MRGKWFKVVKVSKDRAGKVKIPAGLIGLCFWEGTDNFGGHKIGLDISGEYGQGIFVTANKVAEFDIRADMLLDQVESAAWVENADRDSEELSPADEAELEQRMLESDITWDEHAIEEARSLRADWLDAMY